ncbi:glycosyltransferase, family 2 [Campylobacter lari]|uniref:glycosyltransferase family 2 protein n=1 Tax=Campylobacter lari TaxID=201 RepID=UPI0021534149|nr:glycosyltransferase [Campylobacter lari]MCR6531590.1 glycosyltransferase [Campylobacter lari]
MSDICLTILIPTFNKQEYIKQTLDSIFMQDTSYLFHIIVCDDHSTDNTLQIVEAYQKKYSNIKIIYSDTNNKLYKNILRGYQKLNTEYFCVLDPDDYWITNNKIQTAIDFLEQNPDYTMFFGNTYLDINGNQKLTYINKRTPHKTISFKNFLNNKFIFGHTSSTFFRNVCFKNNIPKKMTNLKNKSNLTSFRGDSFRNVLHLEKGLAYYSAEIDSVYRITNAGIWQSKTEIEQNFINCIFYKDMFEFFDEKYISILVRSYQIYIRNKNFESLLLNKNYTETLSTLAILFFMHKKELCHIIYKNSKIKYKILYKIYSYLKYKLIKKGIS